MNITMINADWHDHMHNAQDIAAHRELLLARGAHLEAMEAAGELPDHLHHWRGEHDLMAEQITARAVALGLEEP